MEVKRETISIDTETVSLKDKTLIAFSYTIRDKTTVVPVRMKTTKNKTVGQAKCIIDDLLKNYKIVFHNSSFDIPVLVNFGIPFELFQDVEDTLIIANMVNENIQHGLKFLVKKYFNHTMLEYKAVCGTGKKQIPFEEVEWEIAEGYAGDDAYWTLRLYNKLRAELNKDKELKELYETVEKPLLLVIADMHINGINIDVKKVKEITEYCTQKSQLAKEKLDILIGDINLNSPKQLREYFIEKKGMPVLKNSKTTNAPSVDKEVLEKYAERCNEAKILLEFRKYDKILKTFIPALTPNDWDMKKWQGIIHANFNQAGTSSGRFSSSSPNMQNIPHVSKSCDKCDADLVKKKGKWTCPDCGSVPDRLYIRDAIIADNGHVLIGADYSQIELRVLAHVSQDFNLMKAYKEGLDIHQQTATACGTSRYDAKTINFGLVYGMGVKTLSKRIGATFDEAQEYIDKYFENYSSVKEFWKQTEEQIRNIGYVKTVFGRKRRISQRFFAKDDYDQGAEIRSIINAIIQGSAADLMKVAMVSMYPQLKKLGARIVSTVHDEVIISAPKDKAKRAYAIVHRAMVESGQSFTVPILVDGHIGNTWEEVH